MIEQQIINEIMVYIHDDTYNYAVMIDGEWGCGKTYFVTNTLKNRIEENSQTDDERKRKIKYISLYGCSSIDDVIEKIVWTLADDILLIIRKNRFIKGKLSSFISKSPKEYGKSISKTTKMILPEIIKKYIPPRIAFSCISEIIYAHKYIFIFDDMERMTCEIDEFFGYLNELVEHAGTKVIVIANENMIEGTDGNHYKQIKEKIIGATYKYVSDANEIMHEMVKKLDVEDEFKKTIDISIPKYLGQMQIYNHCNLRTFQFFLSRAKRVLEEFAKLNYDRNYSEKLVEDLCMNALTCAIESKCNYSLHSDDWNMKFMRESIMVSKAISTYIETGVFEKEILVEDVNRIILNYKNAPGPDDPLNLLQNEYYLHDQRWSESRIKEIIDKWAENRYSTEIYIRILMVLIGMEKIGFDIDITAVRHYMLLGMKAAKKERLQADLFAVENNDIKNKVLSIVEEMNSEMSTHRNAVTSITVQAALLRENWVDELNAIVEIKGDAYNLNFPMFYRANAADWWNALSKSTPEDIFKFRKLLQSLYPDNSSKKEMYSKDGPTICELLNLVSENKESEKDLIKKNSYMQLEAQIRRIIKINAIKDPEN